MLLGMNNIFRDMICNHLITYIHDVIMSSKNYKQHVEALRQVLQRLQDQQFLLQESQCHSFTKRLDILEHILSPQGLSAEPLKVEKFFDVPESEISNNYKRLLGS